jgi:hypothetical protein
LKKELSFENSLFFEKSSTKKENFFYRNLKKKKKTTKIAYNINLRFFNFETFKNIHQNSNEISEKSSSSNR